MTACLSPQQRERERVRLRDGRPRAVRAKSVGLRDLAKRHLRLVQWPEGVERPRTRAECVHGPRPCLFIGCRYNLYLDVSDAGSIKWNFPDIEPDEMPARGSCALDIADRGPSGVIRISRLLNLTREATRLVVVSILRKLAKSRRAAELKGGSK